MTEIKLLSSGLATIVVQKEVAERSILIKNMLEDVGVVTEAILIPIVNESVLKKVFEWCEHHKGDPPTAADDNADSRKKLIVINEWDQKFMQVDQEMLLEIIILRTLSPSIELSTILALNPLLDIGCKTVANTIKGKSPDEIRKILNIQKDFTTEEEEQIRRENEWAE
ncbi:hypothetical protein RUND412_005532, partial [Rhizina undulata]